MTNQTTQYRICILSRSLLCGLVQRWGRGLNLRIAVVKLELRLLTEHLQALYSKQRHTHQLPMSNAHEVQEGCRSISTPKEKVDCEEKMHARTDLAEVALRQQRRLVAGWTAAHITGQRWFRKA